MSDRRRKYKTLIVGCMACVGIGAIVVALDVARTSARAGPGAPVSADAPGVRDATPSVSLSAGQAKAARRIRVPFANLAVGTNSIFAVVFRNQATTAVSVADLDISCSCVRVLESPRVLEGGATGLLRLAVLPTAFEDTVAATITIKTTLGTWVLEAEGIVHGPFQGWPRCAQARRSGTEWFVPVSAEYASATVRVALRDDPETIPALYDPQRGGFAVANAPGGALDVIADLLGDRRFVWSGPACDHQ